MKLSAAITLIALAAPVTGFAPPVVSRQGTVLQATNANPFGGKSLEFNEDNEDSAKNRVRLSDALNEADIDRRKAKDEADKRARAAEIKREELLAKIKHMEEMLNDTPASTVNDFMFKAG
mmetsp:Transcript_16954/g.19514  ORF Transcript_16954/g.19514 Transcript_16954/m.19514 type:complete len:120 (+) Transcript_16954:89-448(+)